MKKEILQSLKILAIGALLLLSAGATAQAKTFAQLDANKTVINIVVVDAKNANTETAGIDYLRSVTKAPASVWVQYGDTMRKAPARIGGKYDLVNDCFYTDKPAAGTWTFDVRTCRWDTAAAK